VKDREVEEADLEEKASMVDRVALLTELAAQLKWGETVGHRLKELAPIDPRKAKLRGKANSTPPVDDPEKKRVWERFVEISDALVGDGLTSLYEMKREDVEDRIDEERNAGEKIWYYIWTNAEVKGQAEFGPFSTTDMSMWLKDGFFGDDGSGEKVLVRREGEPKFHRMQVSLFE